MLSCIYEWHCSQIHGSIVSSIWCDTGRQAWCMCVEDMVCLHLAQMLIIGSEDNLLWTWVAHLFWILESEAGNNIKLLFMGIKEEMQSWAKWQIMKEMQMRYYVWKQFELTKQMVSCQASEKTSKLIKQDCESTNMLLEGCLSWIRRGDQPGFTPSEQNLGCLSVQQTGQINFQVTRAPSK